MINSLFDGFILIKYLRIYSVKPLCISSTVSETLEQRALPPKLIIHVANIGSMLSIDQCWSNVQYVMYLAPTACVSPCTGLTLSLRHQY